MKILTLSVIAFISPLCAAPLVPSQIPASAKWMLHADLDAMRASETGKAIFTRIEADHGAKLRAFKRMFSLHPLDDLHGVTLYGDGKPKRAVALIHGTFDRAHMEDVVKAAKDYSSAAHAGFSIHSWTDKKEKQHAAFASDTLLVFSHQDDLLRQALDILKANAPVAGDPFFAADGGHPLIAASAKLAEIELPADAARTLRMASGMHVAIVEAAGRFSIRAHAESVDTNHANRLRRMIDGVLAFAEAAKPDLTRMDFRYEIKLTEEKPGLTAAITLPVNEWLVLMQQAAENKGGKN